MVRISYVSRSCISLKKYSENFVLSPCTGEGEEKCGAVPEIYAGFCTTLCCEEQTCYDWTTFEPSSCVAWGEECPTGLSFDALKGKAITMADASAMKNHASKLQAIKATKTKVLTLGRTYHKGIEMEEVSILRKLKNGGSRESSDKDLPAFMLAVN